MTISEYKMVKLENTMLVMQKEQIADDEIIEKRIVMQLQNLVQTGTTEILD